jgi:hypothetical protein
MTSERGDRHKRPTKRPAAGLADGWTDPHSGPRDGAGVVGEGSVAARLTTATRQVLIRLRAHLRTQRVSVRNAWGTGHNDALAAVRAHIEAMLAVDALLPRLKREQSRQIVFMHHRPYLRLVRDIQHFDGRIVGWVHHQGRKWVVGQEPANGSGPHWRVLDAVRVTELQR